MRTVSDWMALRVVLVSHGDVVLVQPPGRTFLVHADHTFADLADAIDVAFARWDLPQLHVFDVEGRRLASGGSETEPDAQDSNDVRIADVGLRLGSAFAYTFDLGERWQHECVVEQTAVDAFAVYGDEPEGPVPVFGWGLIPDQYGRTSEDDDEPGETWAETLSEFDDDLDEETLAAWDEVERSSWSVVERALADVDRPLDDRGLARAVEALREHEDNDDWPYDVLWAAGGLDDGGLPADDRELWLELAVGVIEPRDALPLDPEAEAAWATLEPADWAGAVIELVRRGVGQRADPHTLVELIAACPEVEGDELTDDDADLLAEGFETVVALWQALGAVDSEQRLTALGRWGLPEALRLAWAS